MNMLFALLILFISCSIGLIVVAIVMSIMGIAGAPGALLFTAGQKAKNSLLRIVGFILTTLGQWYVVGAYTVFIVGLLRWFSETRPEVPTWPLWIAAFLHSGAAPTYAMKEKPEEPAAQHLTLGIVDIAVVVTFFIVAFTPQMLSSLYGWVPYFNRMIN